MRAKGRPEGKRCRDIDPAAQGFIAPQPRKCSSTPGEGFSELRFRFHAIPDALLHPRCSFAGTLDLAISTLTRICRLNPTLSAPISNTSPSVFSLRRCTRSPTRSGAAWMANPYSFLSNGRAFSSRPAIFYPVFFSLTSPAVSRASSDGFHFGGNSSNSRNDAGGLLPALPVFHFRCSAIFPPFPRCVQFVLQIFSLGMFAAGLLNWR